jgi:phosphate transport system substrate-binding protein
MLFYEAPRDRQRARIMVDFVKWALTEGQKDAAPLGYAPLPGSVVKLEMDALKRIQL